MTTIAIAVLAILLAITVYKSTKSDIVDCCTIYVGLVKEFFSKKVLNEFKDDIKHVGSTLLKAFGQIGRALKLVIYWLSVPVLIVLFPVLLAVGVTYKALTK